MEVCIIGGGFSGIASCKQALKHGLVPLVLEKKSNIGGLWQGEPNSVGVWNDLDANSSKQMMWFSDHPWPSDDPEYPSRSQVCSYLLSYVSKHNLNQYISLNSNVEEVTQVEEAYSVTWTSGSITHKKTFKYIIIASGKYSKNCSPLPNSQNFKGKLVLAGDFRESSIFQGKKVVCIGKSFSASDIAAQATENAESVVQVFRRPSILMDKFVFGVPFEYAYYNMRDVHSESSPFHTIESNIEMCRNLIPVCGNPGDLHPDMALDEEYFSRHFIPFVIVSDKYKDCVRSGKIQCIKGNAVSLFEDGVVLEDGRHLDADVVVMGCGYSTNYQFLSSEIKEIIQYDEEDQLLQTILYRSIFHPRLPGLAFVGNFIFGFPGRFELQSEIAFRFLLNTLNLTDEEVNQGLAKEEFIRKNQRELKVPYKFYEYGKDLMRVLGLRIDLNLVENEFKWKNGAILPSFYFLEQEEMRNISIKVIQEIKEKYPGLNGS